ncbi:unnamed protein product, partial [Scytosiphon promiscuus]
KAQLAIQSQSRHRYRRGETSARTKSHPAASLLQRPAKSSQRTSRRTSLSNICSCWRNRDPGAPRRAPEQAERAHTFGGRRGNTSGLSSHGPCSASTAAAAAATATTATIAPPSSA